MSGSVWYLSISKKSIEFKKYPSKKKKKKITKKNSKKLGKKKNFLIFTILFFSFVFFSALVSAAEINDTLHLNIQSTYTNGSIQEGTFTFSFNITESSNSSSCETPIVYNHSVSKTTDSRGIVSIYLPQIGSGGGNLSSLNYDKQYYLCYYKDGTLKDVTQLGRVPYSFRATQVNLSEISVDSNLTLDNYNISSNYGFFSFLGSLADRITKIFATDADISNNLSIGENLSVDGSVGIGISNPSGRLHVSTSTQPSAFVINNSTGYIGLGTSSPDYRLDVASDSIRIDSTSGSSVFYFASGGANEWSLQGNSSAFSIYEAGSGEKFRIASGGNTGIGTIDPQNKLNVIGTFNVTGSSYFPGHVCGAGEVLTTTSTGQLNCVTDQQGAGGTITGSGTATFIPLWNSSSTINNSIIYQLGTRIGINTQTPQNTLNVIGDGNFTGTIYQAENQVLDTSTSFGGDVSGTYNNLQLGSGVVGSDELAADSINTTHIINGTITGTDIQDGSIGNVDLANDSLTVSAGSGLTGGGSVALGGTTTLSVNFGDNFLGWDNLTNYPAGCPAGHAVQVINDTLTCINISAQGADTLDGYDSSFFMPLNKSVYGDFDFNDGWQNGGFSIVGGDIYAQTGYFYNISSLEVTTLEVNGSLIPDMDDSFDLGNSSYRWRDIYFSRDAFALASDASDNSSSNSADFILRGRYDSNTSIGGITQATRDVTLRNIVDWASGTGQYRLAFLNDSEAEIVTFEGDTGRVGIGTSSPQNTLNVIGDGNFTGNLYGGTVYSGGSEVLTSFTETDPHWTGNFTNVAFTNVNELFDENLSVVKNFSADGNTLFVDSNNDRVGIGTSDPNAQLEVSNGARFNAIRVGENTNKIQFGNNADAIIEGISSFESSINNISIRNSNEGNINFWINGTERLRIDSDGNVGIGTTTLQQKLHVNGSAVINGTLNLDSNQINNVANGTSSQDAVTLSQLQAVNGTGNLTGGGTTNNITKWTGSGTLGNSVIYENSGNVSIGTTGASTGKLTVAGLVHGGGSSGDAFRIGNDAFLVDIDTANTIGVQGNQNRTVGSIKLGSGGGTISGNNSNIGIGTTNPSAKFEVHDAGGALSRFNTTSATDSRIEFYRTSLREGLINWDRGELRLQADGNSSDSNLTFYAGGPERLRITSSGNVGIGVDDPQYDLEVGFGNTSDNVIAITRDESGNRKGGTITAKSNSNNLYIDTLGTDSIVLQDVWEFKRDGILYTRENDFILNTNNLTGTQTNKFTVLGQSDTAYFQNLNLGIATTTPQQKLHVNGSAVFNGTLNLDSNQINNLANGTSSQDAVTLSQLQAVNGTGNLTGGGTTNTVAKFTGSSSIGDSLITDDGTIVAVDTSDLYVNTSSGNVGIGTTSPSTKLHVNGSIFADSSGKGFIFGTNISEPLLTVGFTSPSNPPNGTYIKTAGGSNRGLEIGSASNGFLDLQTSSGGVRTSRLYIASAGYIGINTTNPGAKLHIVDDSSSSHTMLDRASNDSQADINFRRARAGTSIVENGDRTGRLLFWGYNGTAYYTNAQIDAIVDGTPGTDMPGALTFYTTPEGSTSVQERLRIDDQGNLGINQTNPQYTFDLNGSGARIATSSLSSAPTGKIQLGTSGNNGFPKLTITREDPGNYGSFEILNAGEWRIGAVSGNSALAFYTSGSEQARISDSGLVGIGTTTPQQALHVNGSAVINGTLNLDSNQINNLANGTSAQDAVTLSQLQAVNGTGNLTGGGTTNTVAKFTGSSSIGDSLITDDGTIVAVDTSDLYVNTSSGNVSIGGTSPSYKLDVSDDSRITDKLYIGNSGGSVSDALTGNGIAVGTSSSSSQSMLILDSAPSSGSSKIEFGGGVDRFGDIIVNETLYQFDARDGDFGFVNGNLGINQTNPQNTLNVIGTFNVTNNTGTLGLYQDDNSNIGIGTSNPGALLQVGTDTTTASEGIRFGTDTSLYRIASNQLRTGGTFSAATQVLTPLLKSLDSSVTFAHESGGDIYIGSTSSGLSQATDIFFKQSGNVGIGTTSPSTKLHVLANDTSNTSLTNLLTLDHITSVSSNGSAGISTGILFRAEDSQAETENIAQIVGNLTTATNGSEASALQFYTRAGGGSLSERLRIDSDGNVGIGTTTPQQKLHVNGSAVINGTLNLDSNQINNVANGTSSQDAVTLSQLQAVNGTGNLTGGGTTNTVAKFTGSSSIGDSLITDDGTIVAVDTSDLYVNTSSGNVGIGTSSPSEKLYISGGNIGFNSSGLIDSQTIVGSNQNDLIINASDYIVIDPGFQLHLGGNKVVIGHSSIVGSSDLWVYGGGTIGTNNGGTLYFRSAENPGGSGADFRFDDSLSNYYFSKIKTNSGDLTLEPASGQDVLINTSGNVGIGTTNTSAKLHLNSTSTPTELILEDTVGGNNRARISFRTNGTEEAAIGFGESGGNLFISPGSNLRVSKYLQLTGTGDDSSVRSSTNQPLSLWTNNARAVHIDTSQQIGIGTTSPSTKLHVLANDTSNTSLTNLLTLDHITSVSSNGSAGISTGILFRAEDSQAETENIAQIVGNLTTATNGSEASALQFYTRAGGGSLSERLRIDSDGNVGINTTSPSGIFHVSTSTQPSAFVINSSTGYIGLGTTNPTHRLDVNSDGIRTNTPSGSALLRFSVGGTNEWSLEGNTSAFSIFETGSGEHFHIANGGDIGIGTTSPQNKLNVIGTFNITGLSYFGDDLDVNANNVTDVDCITFNSGGKICSA